jgi:Tol biopolymer transport system component
VNTRTGATARALACASCLGVSSVALATAPREITTVEGGHVQRPVWSPAGQLAWEVNFVDTKRLQLHVGGVDGTSARVRPPARARSTLAQGFQTSTAEGAQHELTWAPASIGAYAYSATTADEDYDLYVGDAAVVRFPGPDGGPAWSPDGTHLVFTSARSGDGDLYLLEVAHIERPPRRLTSLTNSSELHASWSPDGRSLAFVAHTATGDNLWVLPSLDAAPVQLTTAPGSQLRPVFSPDGEHLAYYATAAGTDTFGLHVMPATPGAPGRRLLDAVVVDGRGPSWLDATTLLAVADEDARFDPIVRVGLDGSRATVDLGTVGNRDLAVGRRDGQVWLAWCAQGTTTGVVRDFRRLYVAPLP